MKRVGENPVKRDENFGVLSNLLTNARRHIFPLRHTQSYDSQENSLYVADTEARLVKQTHISEEDALTEHDPGLSSGARYSEEAKPTRGKPTVSDQFRHKTETTGGKSVGEGPGWCCDDVSRRMSTRMSITDRRRNTMMATPSGDRKYVRTYREVGTCERNSSVGPRKNSEFRLQLDNKMLHRLIGHVNVLICLVVLVLIVLVVGGGVLIWKVQVLIDQVRRADIDNQSVPYHNQLTVSPLDPTIIRDCYDVQLLGYRRSGVYWIFVKDDVHATQVYCDMEHAGGGWMVLLRRKDNSVSFARSWQEYKHGFGDLEGEFWAGNELMHKMTNVERKYTLRVDMTSFERDTLYAEYTEFSVATESDFYRLHVSGYSGTAGNSLQYHDNSRFSTQEFDNDMSPQHCAVLSGAAWWFNDCHQVLLTGTYGAYPGVDGRQGISWKEPWGKTKFAKFVEIKIRPSSLSNQ